MAARELPDPRGNRARRDGCDLPCAATPLETDRGSKARAELSRRLARDARAFPPRSRGSGESRSPKHSADLRSGRSGRASLLHHEAGHRRQPATRGGGSERRAARVRPVARQSRARNRVCAPQWDPAPRSQAWKYPAGCAWRTARERLRLGEVDGGEHRSDAQPRDLRHAGVHCAGAGRRPRRVLTPAADIYSLGAILFDLLTGRPPFLGEHALSVIHQAAEKAAPRLRTINASLDRDLETICAKCLEREPQARYRAAADLAEDLERWLEGRPIVARPVSVPAKLWRWSKRNKLLSGTVTVGVAIAAVTVWWALENRRLQETIVRQTAERHSLIIESVLDLDTATNDRTSTNAVASAFRKGFTALGPANILTSDANRTGLSAPTSSARWSLATTVRKVNGRTRSLTPSHR